jgi:hypothetical protein
MAQFVGDVFGLNAVYDKQLENIANGNFASWSEGATYGYFAGGQPPNTGISSIDRLDFFTEVLSSPGTPLGRNTNEFDGFSSGLYGYFGGGDTPGGASDTRVDRLDFSTETISNPGNYLTGGVGRQIHAATSSTSYGYFGGGDNSGTLINTITRLDFSSETVSNPGNNLPTPRFALAATESSSYGYFGGGDGTVNGGTPLSTVTRLDFSNDSISSPGNPLTAQRTESATISNVNSYGYFGGGNPTYESVGLSTSIIRLDFSNEISVTLENFGLTNRKEKLSGVYGNNSGYFAGGLSGIPRAVSDTIERFNFSNQTLSTIPSVLSIAKNSMGALSGGQSILRGKGFKTYGYFGAGNSGGLGDRSTIDRLDFSTETVSTPTPKLFVARSLLTSYSSNYYGYFIGGTPDPGGTVDRLDFSNETRSNTFSLPNPVDSLAAFSSNSYGYFGGGRPGTKQTITRLDFSNETLYNPGKNLNPGRFEFTSVRSRFYGYFGGGDSVPGGTMNLITRLDFSNETVSNPGKNLPADNKAFAGTSGRFYGYFGGGKGDLCKIDRLDFSTEIISTLITVLPQGREGLSATESSSYGYFGGGKKGAGEEQTVERLNFFTETASLVADQLSNKSTNLAAVSNSN